ncbi:MAG: sodium:solute symporter family protein [Chloroflexi bacterium]|nr:MAG: sodium:solute symporter family protein [Chloroflexota bacterium]
MMLSPVHLLTIILTLLLATGLGLYSRRRVHTAADFAVGGRAVSAPVVAGTIIGTLVGGASTIGTAQLAFEYGFSAWWFTLGGGIACLLLAMFLAGPLRRSGASTGPGFLSRVYGPQAGLLATLFSSLGIFLNIVGQILSIIALLTAITGMPPFAAALVAVLVIIAYVVFGGVWSTGLVGSFKTALLYLSMVVVGVLAYRLGGGLAGFQAAFAPYPWFSLFGRGVGTDLAAGFSLVVGVLSTQTYLQAVFSGRDAAASRLGALTAALVIPPIGLAGIAVGLYMRATAPTIAPREALPLFILQYLPDWLGGLVLVTLFIAAIGTGAGLVLGVSTMFTEDIYRRLVPHASDRQLLLTSRLAVVGVTGLGLAFVSGNLNSLILEWSFLSMGLRGATLFWPLLAAVFAPRHVSPKAGVWAIGLGPLSAVLWAVLGPESVDPLYVGLSVSLGVLLAGSWLFRLEIGD